MVLCSGIIMCCCELWAVNFVQCDGDFCVVLCSVTVISV